MTVACVKATDRSTAGAVMVTAEVTAVVGVVLVPVASAWAIR